MDLKPLYRWLRGTVPPIRPDDQAIARQAYADYLRAQIIGYAPEHAHGLLGALKTEDRSGIARTSATFAELMGVETRLAGALDDDMVRHTYWIVRERFNRVGSAAAAAEHSKWAPPGLVEAADKVPLTPAPAPTDMEDESDDGETDRADDAEAHDVGDRVEQAPTDKPTPAHRATPPEEE